MEYVTKRPSKEHMAPAGHPIYILMEEHRIILEFAGELKDTAKKMAGAFPRARAVIGRKVQQCHPQKSLHIVTQILEDFKTGQRGTAQFWINLKNRLIYIRYFAVRSKNGDYLGCLEVTQDITEIKGITGEKRLLEY